jgi:hypothetical protein
LDFISVRHRAARLCTSAGRGRQASWQCSATVDGGGHFIG